MTQACKTISLNDTGSLLSNRKACYAAFKAHDARFDGRLFICVASTGIYCRPVCKVRTPNETNCSFQPSAAAAEAAGYRPCLKCRPELAPGHTRADASGRLARKASDRIDADHLAENSLSGLAESLGITDRHLRRVFANEFGVSPVQYLRTKRLLLAKSLITDTSLPITDIAFTAGFGSLRQFNDLFRAHYRMTPTLLRRQGMPLPRPSRESITVLVGYRPPYRWDALLSFLKRALTPNVEIVHDDAYIRTLSVKNGNIFCEGWIAIENRERQHALAVTIAPSLLPVLPQILTHVRRMFDTGCDPHAIFETLSGMNEIMPDACVTGTRLPGCFSPYELAIRLLLERTLPARDFLDAFSFFVSELGERIETPFEDLTRLFPAPETLASRAKSMSRTFARAGITPPRIEPTIALAKSVAAGHIDLSPLSDFETELSKPQIHSLFDQSALRQLAMRAYGWPDILPHADRAVTRFIRSFPANSVDPMLACWSPWRSYVAANLWCRANTAG